MPKPEKSFAVAPWIINRGRLHACLRNKQHGLVVPENPCSVFDLQGIQVTESTKKVCRSHWLSIMNFAYLIDCIQTASLCDDSVRPSEPHPMVASTIRAYLAFRCEPALKDRKPNYVCIPDSSQYLLDVTGNKIQCLGTWKSPSNHKNHLTAVNLLHRRFTRTCAGAYQKVCADCFYLNYPHHDLKSYYSYPCDIGCVSRSVACTFPVEDGVPLAHDEESSGSLSADSNSFDQSSHAADSELYCKLVNSLRIGDDSNSLNSWNSDDEGDYVLPTKPAKNSDDPVPENTAANTVGLLPTTADEHTDDPVLENTAANTVGVLQSTADEHSDDPVPENTAANTVGLRTRSVVRTAHANLNANTLGNNGNSNYDELVAESTLADLAVIVPVSEMIVLAENIIIHEDDVEGPIDDNDAANGIPDVVDVDVSDEVEYLEYEEEDGGDVEEVEAFEESAGRDHASELLHAYLSNDSVKSTDPPLPANRNIGIGPLQNQSDWKSCRDHSGNPRLQYYGNVMNDTAVKIEFKEYMYKAQREHIVKGCGQLQPKELIAIRTHLLQKGKGNIRYFMLWVMILTAIKLFLRADEVIKIKVEDFNDSFMNDPDERKDRVINELVKCQVINDKFVHALACEVKGKSDQRVHRLRIFSDLDCTELDLVRTIFWWLHITKIKKGYLFPCHQELKAIVLAKQAHETKISLDPTTPPHAGFVVEKHVSYQILQKQTKEVITAVCHRGSEFKIGTHTYRKTAYLLSIWGILYHMYRARNKTFINHVLPDFLTNGVGQSARHRSNKHISEYAMDSMTTFHEAILMSELIDGTLPEFKSIHMNLESTQSLTSSTPFQKPLYELAHWFIDEVVQPTENCSQISLLDEILKYKSTPDVAENSLKVAISPFLNNPAQAATVMSFIREYCLHQSHPVDAVRMGGAPVPASQVTVTANTIPGLSENNNTFGDILLEDQQVSRLPQPTGVSTVAHTQDSTPTNLQANRRISLSPPVDDFISVQRICPTLRTVQPNPVAHRLYRLSTNEPVRNSNKRSCPPSAQVNGRRRIPPPEIQNQYRTPRPTRTHYKGCILPPNPEHNETDLTELPYPHHPRHNWLPPPHIYWSPGGPNPNNTTNHAVPPLPVNHRRNLPRNMPNVSIAATPVRNSNETILSPLTAGGPPPPPLHPPLLCRGLFKKLHVSGYIAWEDNAQVEYASRHNRKVKTLNSDDYRWVRRYDKGRVHLDDCFQSDMGAFTASISNKERSWTTLVSDMKYCKICWDTPKDKSLHHQHQYGTLAAAREQAEEKQAETAKKKQIKQSLLNG